MESIEFHTVLQTQDRRSAALGNLKVLPDEIICSILNNLAPRDVAKLSCVSSVMYILCNEEPLWMILCLEKASGLLQYKGTWKKTALSLENVPSKYIERCTNRLQFHGFSSMFLYRRFYRCNTKLDCFEFDSGNVDRKKNLTLHEFSSNYDGRKPVLISGLSDSWPATTSWTIDKLCEKYGETPFKISQISARKISMKLGDYVSYMKEQHDEDPLYIFDAQFGECAPFLMKEFSVPDVFQEDWFDVLDEEERPPYRWIVIGPERSGASWHVDPALTSAWNTLLCGKKRWALYPPGKVPFGVTVHVNDEDGDVNIDTPTSLQWWLDYYPLISNEEKPIECTQMPGETIYVPSGWWHCVLNLENAVAVTQNFVNSNNFEYVCLDMAPGYVHKGLSRAGLLAIDDDCSVLTFSYDAQFLSKFLAKEKDHFTSQWCSGNCIDQRVFRQWLSKLWAQKPQMRPLLWKGACIALNADTWLSRLHKICAFYKIPFPSTEEELPSGFGSNPVYVAGNYVIKILVEGGIENALYSLGSELQLHDSISKQNSPLKNHIPQVLACGVVSEDVIIPWEPTKLPEISRICNVIPRDNRDGYAYGVWGKKLWEYEKAGVLDESNVHESTRVYPFIITKRFQGKTYAHIRRELSSEEALNLASFLGEHVRTLHLLPYPSFNSVSDEWKLFLTTLSKKKTTAVRRLQNWGYPIPDKLIKQVDDYIPDDLTKLTEIFLSGEKKLKTLSWIHSDIMDDNVMMEYSNGWVSKRVIDFSDINIGDRLLDVIPIYLDIFRGDRDLILKFLHSYGFPLGGSYHAMCYCILHDENVLSAIFDIWKDLRKAVSWEEVELTVWGFLNEFDYSSL